MDWRGLPPLNGLRAFAVVAETGSYTRAAAQLNVTHAAVRQQVRQLEVRLSAPLVLRSGRGMRLTEQGVALARDLNVGFAAISRAIERLSDDLASRPIQITTSPAFAVEWLMPRLVEFQQANPGIPLLLNPTAEVVALRPGGVDVAIRYRDRRRPVDDVKPLLISDMIVIGAAELVTGQDLSSPASLTELPWLQELGTSETAEWFTLHGVVPEQPLIVNQMPGNLIMSAVRRGDGLAYTARAFFRRDLEERRVVELFSEPRFGIYHVETAPPPLRNSVQIFLDWLFSHAETVTL